MFAGSLIMMSAAHADSVFWRPYVDDPEILALFHCDGNATAAEDTGDLDVFADHPPDALGNNDQPVPENALRNSHPMGVNARLNGGATRGANGRFGGGVSLPGAGAGIVCQAGTGRGTAEFWVRLDALPETPTAVFSRTAPGEATGLALLVLPDGAIQLTVGRQRFTSEPGCVRAQQWAHLAVTTGWEFEFNGLVRVYANGAAVFSEEPHWDYRVANQIGTQQRRLLHHR